MTPELDWLIALFAAILVCNMLQKKKVVIAISSVPRTVVFEWMLESELSKFVDMQFLLFNVAEFPIETNLRKLGAKVDRIYYKNIFSLLPALLKTIVYLRKEKPDVIHTHLQGANLAGLPAAWLLRTPSRITTRHHSNPYHLHHKHALLYDRLINFLSTKIVVACENVADVLVKLEGVNPNKLFRIPFAVRKKDYDNISESRRAEMRKKYSLEKASPVVGMVARYLKIKGLQYAIPAFKRFLQKYPEACLIISNAHGTYEQEVHQLLSELPPSAYREIKMEFDMPALYSVMDLFLHVPIDRESEAFGQAYTESLMAALPAVFTLSGVAPEIIVHGENARVVPFQSEEGIYDELCWIMEHKELAQKMAQHGRSLMLEKFSFEEFIERHKKLYLSKS